MISRHEIINANVLVLQPAGLDLEPLQGALGSKSHITIIQRCKLEEPPFVFGYQFIKIKLFLIQASPGPEGYPEGNSEETDDNIKFYLAVGELQKHNETLRSHLEV